MNIFEKEFNEKVAEHTRLQEQALANLAPGKSIVELADTKSGRVTIMRIADYIEHGMVARFGPMPHFARLEIIDDGTLDTVVRHTRTGQSQSYSSEYRFEFDSDVEFLDAIEDDFDD
jgi:hypothetical protein